MFPHRVQNNESEYDIQNNNFFYNIAKHAKTLSDFCKMMNICVQKTIEKKEKHKILFCIMYKFQNSYFVPFVNFAILRFYTLYFLYFLFLYILYIYIQLYLFIYIVIFIYIYIFIFIFIQVYIYYIYIYTFIYIYIFFFYIDVYVYVYIFV